MAKKKNKAVTALSKSFIYNKCMKIVQSSGHSRNKTLKFLKDLKCIYWSIKHAIPDIYHSLISYKWYKKK